MLFNHDPEASIIAVNVVPRFFWSLLGVYGVPRKTSIAVQFRPAGVGVNVSVGYRLEDAYGSAPLV